MRVIKILLVLVLLLHINTKANAQLRFNIDSIRVSRFSPVKHKTFIRDYVPTVHITGTVINEGNEPQVLFLWLKKKGWTEGIEYIYHFSIQQDSLETEILYDLSTEGEPHYSRYKDFHLEYDPYQFHNQMDDMACSILPPGDYLYFDFWGYFLYERRFSNIQNLVETDKDNISEINNCHMVLSELAAQFNKDKAVLIPVFKKETSVAF